MLKTNRDAALKWAEFALAEKHCGRRESASGPGSSLESTAEVRQFVLSCIEDFAITSIADLGCGDWNWMQQVMRSPTACKVRYTGWDIHPGMIDSLQTQHGSATVAFAAIDIFAAPLPPAELIICRDVLFHVDIGMAAELVRRIMNSTARYFLSTSFPGEPINANIAPYLPIEGWGFHRINLDIAPFDLADRLVRKAVEPRCGHQDRERFVCLYAIGKQAP